MKKLRIGIIGLGQRGMSMLKSIWLGFDEVEISAVCDTYADRVEKAKELVKEKSTDAKEPFTSTDYNEVLTGCELDAVYVASSWETHTEVAIEAMTAVIPENSEADNW